MRYREGFAEFCRRNIKKIILIGVISIVVSFYLAMQKKNGMYIMDDGCVKGIRVSDEEIAAGKKGKSKRVPIIVEGKKKGVSIKEDAVLHVALSDSEKKKPDKPKDEKEDKVREEISDVIKNLGRVENIYEGKLRLPSTLKDGTKLSWKAPEDNSHLLLLLTAPVITFLMYSAEQDKKNKRRKLLKDDVLKNIPGFAEQLVLFMGSGQIFQDAYIRVTEIYRERKGESEFAELVVKAGDDAQKTGRDSVSLLSEYAAELNVRELTRLARLIENNRESGIDLSDKLEEEGALLWKMRKEHAEVEGKKAEIRLCFPLALLLLVLLIITGAPALLTI